MNKKVILILSDGVRPDSLEACGHPFVNEMIERYSHTLNAKTVVPPVTLPCHMSLFHSVDPQRHGILTNTFVPHSDEVKGICEVLRRAGKKCALFYNWGEIKDLARPDSLAFSMYVSGHQYPYVDTNERLTDSCISYVNSDQPDFVFLYLGWTDMAGHTYGWMTPEYIDAVNESISCIERVIKSVSDDYVVVFTADHGGHNRSHGADIPEDMTIPVFFCNKELTGKTLENVGIMDIAPTITSLLGVPADPEWEGKEINIY